MFWLGYNPTMISTKRCSFSSSILIIQSQFFLSSAVFSLPSIHVAHSQASSLVRWLWINREHPHTQLDNYHGNPPIMVKPFTTVLWWVSTTIWGDRFIIWLRFFVQIEHDTSFLFFLFSWYFLNSILGKADSNAKCDSIYFLPQLLVLFWKFHIFSHEHALNQDCTGQGIHSLSWGQRAMSPKGLD